MKTEELEQIYTQLAQTIGAMGAEQAPLFLATLSLDLLSKLSFEDAQIALQNAQALTKN